jgi:hypothetical protein
MYNEEMTLTPMTGWSYVFIAFRIADVDVSPTWFFSAMTALGPAEYI